MTSQAPKLERVKGEWKAVCHPCPAALDGVPSHHTNAEVRQDDVIAFGPPTVECEHADGMGSSPCDIHGTC